MGEKYRWSTPYEWLEWKSRQWTRDELLQALLSVALQEDSDTLQDLFQSEMDEDGYFDVIKEPMIFVNEAKTRMVEITETGGDYEMMLAWGYDLPNHVQGSSLQTYYSDEHTEMMEDKDSFLADGVIG